MGLFDNYCKGCGKSIPTHAKDRQGNLPEVFCGRVCETDHKSYKQMVNNKNIVTLNKSIDSDTLTSKMAQVSWRPNNGGQYVLKDQIVSEEVAI